jgi:hypothetical protein
MDNIDDIFEVSTFIEQKKLIIKFESKDNVLTDLKIIKFLNKMESVLEGLYDDRIKSFYFIFVIDEFQIPPNMGFLKDFSELLKKHGNNIVDKLDFTIIQNDSNIFQMFFNLFKSYYKPVKSLYLCKNHEECQDCLHNMESRQKYPNIISMIKNE